MTEERTRVPKKIPDYGFALHSIKRTPVQTSDFKIFSRSKKTPVIEIIPGDLTTKRLDADLAPDDLGEKHPRVDCDIAKLCVVARHGVNDNVGKGFVHGFNLQGGAIASSVGHDSHNLIVAGTSDEDMAAAVNALIRSGGGYTAVRDGRILALVEFPVGGLMSEKSMKPLTDDMKKLYEAVRETGCTLPDPFMQLAFLTLPVIPFLKITDKGVFDTDAFQFVEV